MPCTSKHRVPISAEFSWVSKVRESRKQARTIHEFTRTARKPSAKLFFFRATSCELVDRTRGSKQIGQSAKVAGDLKIRKLLMYGSGKRYEDLCAIYVDLGTSSTRVWLMRGTAILTRVKKPVGVSDTARDGSNIRIRAMLKESIEDVLNQINDTSCLPACVAAAGMI